MNRSGRPFHVLIVGAGTGGLALAHALKRGGIGVTVFERDRTRVDGLQGYRVGISPAGSRALAECVPTDLYRIFLATCARPPLWFNILTERMGEVLSLPVLPSADPDAQEHSVSRMTLRQVLLTGLEEDVRFDKRFENYEAEPGGGVTARFEDGTVAKGDLLVGADGAGSRVRRQLLPHARQEATGIVSIGAKVPLTAETRRLLPAKAERGVSLVMAPRGLGAILHVMEFPRGRDIDQGGVGGNDADLVARWPGLLFDNTADYIMWGVWAARRHFPTDPLRIDRGELPALARRLTEGWHPDFRSLVDRADPTTAFAINIRTSVPVAPWSAGPVTLLGDAIHTMTPGRGVGANTALRDAALLGRNLASTREGCMTLGQAVEDYQSRMLRYGFAAVRDSRKQMDDRALVHRPVIGRVALGAMRAGMRAVNASPALKRRMAEARARSRGADGV